MVAVLSFFKEALVQPEKFLQSNSGTISGDNRLTTTPTLRTFGLNSELFYRNCYDEITDEIELKADEFNGASLFEIRGSAGIGKSVFLAFLMAREVVADDMKNFALFHAPKKMDLVAGCANNDVLCSVWIDGKMVLDGARYESGDTADLVQSYLPKLELMFMDGCSMLFSLGDFDGFIFAAVSPSINTTNMRKELGNQWCAFHMPPWSRKEYLEAGKLLGIDPVILEENYEHMNGIIRYAFKKGSAASKLKDAIEAVNPKSISKMLQSNTTDKDTNEHMVHALVLWNPQVNENGGYDYTARFSYALVSRVAERKVADKLFRAELVDLKYTRQALSAVSGAEGYAGALFEAYAIKKIRNGGIFKVFGIDHMSQSEQDPETLEISQMTEDPIVLKGNTISTQFLGLDELLLKAPSGYKPRLIWPETTNFPTFDAFYLHGDGEIYCLQMTVAELNGDLHHVLKNSGAYQSMKYLERVRSVTKHGNGKYKAVFVVPENTLKAKRQDFKGTVKLPRKELLDEKEASDLMNSKFEQYIMYV